MRTKSCLIVWLLLKNIRVIFKYIALVSITFYEKEKRKSVSKKMFKMYKDTTLERNIYI